MGWSIGYDKNWGRDIGYGVPAVCDHPSCNESIDRGLSYVCGTNPYGGERGCGLYFCGKHMCITPTLGQLCERCYPKVRKPFPAKPECVEWITFQLKDESWGDWRKKNRKKVKEMTEGLERGVYAVPTAEHSTVLLNG